MFQPIKPGPGAVEKVQQEIEAINVREKSLIAECQAKGAEAAAAEKESGARFLAGEEGALMRVRELHDEIQLREQAIATLAERRTSAEIRLQAAEVDVLRQKRKDLAGELEVLQRETGKALERLGKLEGVAFTERILNAQPHDFLTSYQGSPAFEWLSPGQYMMEPVNGGYYQPRSRQLREEINALDKRVKEAETVTA